MRTRELESRMVLLAVILLLGGATLAGQVEVSDYGREPLGGPVLECDEEGGDQGGEIDDCAASQADVGWGGPDDLFCLDTPINGGGDQNVELTEMLDCEEGNTDHGLRVETLYDGEGNVLGVEIRHADGREVAALCLSESSEAIESVRISLDHGSMAKIGKLPTRVPYEGGFVDVELNGELFVFVTRAFQSAGGGLNALILDTLAKAGYRVAQTRGYMMILEDPWGARIDEVRVSSSEPAITHTEVSLEPQNTFNFQYCFPPDQSPQFESSGPRNTSDGPAEISRF